MGLLGHSEGAWLAAIVADRHPEDVALVIALAGHAVTGAELLPVQAELGLRASGAPEEQIEAILADQVGEIELIASGDWDAPEAHVHEQALAALQSLSMVALQGWLYTFVTESPSDAWSGVAAPVLAVFGGLDTQVAVTQNRGPLEAALSTNDDVTVDVIADANHLFRQAATPGDAYASLDPELHSDILVLVSEWLSERVP